MESASAVATRLKQLVFEDGRNSNSIITDQARERIMAHAIPCSQVAGCAGTNGESAEAA